MLGGCARIRRFVVEAVVQPGIGNYDEAIVGERDVHHLLDLGGIEGNLFSVPSASLASTRMEPISVLSRSFAPGAPALCQLTPEADSFHVAEDSSKAVFKR